MLCLAIFPLENLLLWPLEGRFSPVAWPEANIENMENTQPLPAKVDGIIVLGGGMDTRLSNAWGQPVLGSPAERVLAVLALAAYYPDAEIIFTGGSGDPIRPDQREADAMAQYLAVLGAKTPRWQFERESMNTVQNVRNSYDIVQPKAGEVWLLVTSASHMPRSVLVFEAKGWTVIPFPVDYMAQPFPDFQPRWNLVQGLHSSHLALKEWVGLVFYRVAGYTNRLWPSKG